MDKILRLKNTYRIGFTDSGIGSLLFAMDFLNKSAPQLKKFGPNIQNTKPTSTSWYKSYDNSNVGKSKSSISESDVGIDYNVKINNKIMIK